ncbi:MAG: Riboflavin transporter [Holosporales bacterium]
MKHLLNKIRLLHKSSFWGGFILVLSMIFMSFGNGFLHFLSTKYAPFSVLFYKSFFALFVLLFFLRSFDALKKTICTSFLKYNILRALVGTLGVLLWIPSVQHLALQEVSALSLTSSFFSAFGGYVLLKEKTTIRKNLCLIFGFLGAYIILHPHFETKNWFYILPIASAFCFGLSAVLARYLALKNQEYTTSFYLFLTMIGISFPFGFVIPSSFKDAVFLGCIGIFYGMAQILYVKAYRYAEASHLAQYKFLKVPLHTLWGVLFFCEVPTFFSILGTIIIICALFLTSIRD